MPALSDSRSTSLHTLHVDSRVGSHPRSSSSTTAPRASLVAASKNSFSSFVIHFSLLLADAILAFMWACCQALHWRPVRRHPRKEPPASVASTALSMMALDYPAHKLSVYVSDDGGSEVTLFAFTEVARFARYIGCPSAERKVSWRGRRRPTSPLRIAVGTPSPRR